MDSEERRRYSVPDWLREEWDGLEQQWKQLTGEVNEVSRPKIQQVPECMAARGVFKKYYLPQLISVGPVHLGPRYAEQGRPYYKARWTAMYLKHTNQSVEDLYQTIFSHYEELRKRFAQDYYKNIRLDVDHDTTWMLLLDGCSILQLLEKSDNSVDPEQELKISIDKLVRVHQDLLILDNQIPFKVLRLLSNDEARLNKCLHNFLEIHGVKMAPSPRTGKPDLGKTKENKSTPNVQAADELKVIVQADDHEDEEDPVHLLDYLRRALLMRDLGQIHKEVKINRKSLHLRKYRIGTIRELKAAGIRVRKDPNNNSFHPSFDDRLGLLQLPELTVDGSTALIFLNLIAYEMCPDFHNDFEISSYVVFLSSLIDQPEDVKELRSAGILINELASDKEVADIFNKMDSVSVPETARFARIRDEIHMHFESKRSKIKMLGWMGEAYNTYFRSPWTVIALLAASLGLVLTFIQTWFAIHPKGS